MIDSSPMAQRIERLVAEPDIRVEHLAEDYQKFKDAHAPAPSSRAMPCSNAA